MYHWPWVICHPIRPETPQLAIAFRLAAYLQSQNLIQSFACLNLDRLSYVALYIFLQKYAHIYIHTSMQVFCVHVHTEAGIYIQMCINVQTNAQTFT